MSREDTIAHAKQLRDTGLALSVIAERLGLSKTGLRDLLRDPDATVTPLSAPRMGVWTDARTALLTKLWGEGKSASEIAMRLACGVSRNAVIGKASRLGLLGSRQKAPAPAKAALRAPSVKPMPRNPVGRLPQSTIRPQAKAFGETKVKPAGIKPMSWGSAVPIPNPEERPAPMRERAETWQPLPGVVPVSILDLTHMHCRWPLDLAGVDLPHACGALPIGGRYCITHGAAARSNAPVTAPKELIRSLRRFAA